MERMLLIGGEVAAVAAALLVSYVTLLLYRAPNHGKWLESDAATTSVMIALMAALIFSLAWLVKGLAGVIEDPLASISIAFAIFFGLAWVMWRLMRMRTRLAAADAGISPFHIAGYKPTEKPRRRRRARGAA